MPLDYNNSIPLYVQLKARLENKILNGTYKGQIPAERKIMDEFYVSRSTVRQAINELVDAGVLRKIRGKGTFVSIKPIDDWLGNLSSTTETIDRMGMEPGARLIKSEVVPLSAELQKTTGLTNAYLLKRIRYANEIPIGIEKSYYPVTLGEKINKYDLNTVTLYDLLELHLGVHTKEAEQVIGAGYIDKNDAELLGIPVNSSVLNVDRRLIDINGNFVEFERAHYRSDMYSFKIKLARNNN